MTELFLAITAAAIGLPVLVICAGLALRRKTRYFAIPPVLGLVSGAIAALTTNGALAPVVFIIAFSIVAVPLAAVCGFVGLMGPVDARWPNGFRNGLLATFAIVAVVLVFGEFDRPGSEPTAQFVGTVRNSSGSMRPDGMVEERMDVALDNGRTVNAKAIRPVTAVPGPFPAPRFPERWEPERVRVNEYRSLITRRPSYMVVGSERRVAGTD
ncbi:MAG: hypothetical protein ACM3SO_15975 [Betaproteobacteria bacterium]